MTTDNIIDQNAPGSEKVSPLNIALKWALISTLLSIIYQMIMLTLNDGKYNPRPEGWYHMVIGTLLLLFTTTMSIKEYRDSKLGGFISYGKAFRSGMLYGLLVSVFSVLFTLVLYNFIIDYDTFYAEQLDIGIESMKKRGMSDEEISKSLAMTPEFVKTQSFSLSMVFLGSLIIHLIVVLIISAILKRNPPANA